MMNSPTPSPAADLATRIAEGLGWKDHPHPHVPDSRCFRPSSPDEKGFLTWEQEFALNLETIEFRSAHYQGGYMIVPYPSYSWRARVDAAQRDRERCRRIDAATDGMLTFGLTRYKTYLRDVEAEGSEFRAVQVLDWLRDDPGTGGRKNG